MVNSSSVRQCLHNKFVKIIFSEKSVFNAKLIEELVVQEIAIGIDSLYKVIPKI